MMKLQTPMVPDDELLLRIACDDNKKVAFETFWNRYDHEVKNICRALCRGNGKLLNWEELRTEVAERIYRIKTPPTFQTGATPEENSKMTKAYIWRIARNLILQRLRGNKSVDTVHMNWKKEENQGSSDVKGIVNQLPFDARNTFDDLSDEELLTASQQYHEYSAKGNERPEVLDCVEKLNPKEQAVVWAKIQFFAPSESKQVLPSEVLDDLETSMGIKRTNIGQTYKRAKAKVKTCLESKTTPLS